MSLVKIGNTKQWNVVTQNGVFAIMEDDAHTAQMLLDFQTDPAKLNEFEALINSKDAPNAYFIYNNLPIPPAIVLEEDEIQE